jgi:hypothetical protein
MTQGARRFPSVRGFALHWPINLKEKMNHGSDFATYFAKATQAKKATTDR